MLIYPRLLVHYRIHCQVHQPFRMVRLCLARLESILPMRRWHPWLVTLGTTEPARRLRAMIRQTTATSITNELIVDCPSAQLKAILVIRMWPTVFTPIASIRYRTFTTYV